MSNTLNWEQWKPRKGPLPIVGYRVWHVRNGSLASPWLPVLWNSRELHASCLMPGASQHVAPGPDCFCGVYALHELQAALKELAPGFVIGSVVGTGSVMVHEPGFRAALATITALGFDSPEPDELLRRIANRYAIPLHPLSKLTVIAEQHGQQITKRRAEEVGGS